MSNKWINEQENGTQFVSAYLDGGFGTRVYQKEERGVLSVEPGQFEFDFDDFGPAEQFITLEEREAKRDSAR